MYDEWREFERPVIHFVSSSRGWTFSELAEVVSFWSDLDTVMDIREMKNRCQEGATGNDDQSSCLSCPPS